MRQVRIHYHRDGSDWWADSPEMPGWTAVGESLEGLRELARAGVREFAGESVAITEIEEPGDRRFPRRSA